MQISDEMKALEALARAYDHEEAACMGEPSPWVSADAEGDDEWKAERIVAARAGLDAYRSALSLPVQPVATSTEFNQIGMTLAFFASAIKSGESWTATCQREYDAAQACLSQLRSSITTPPAHPTKGPEDDLIAARAAAKEAGGEHSYVAVQAALLALRSRPASALPVVGEDALTELAKHRNWELSCGEDPQIEGEMRWQVHSVNGGRNDREWTLIGTGDTPEAAIRSAIIPSVQP